MVVQFWTLGIGSPDLAVIGASGAVVGQFIEVPAQPASANTQARRVGPKNINVDFFITAFPR
jgi:hypothetical protein